jgi:O-antigen/teichoic acid export membrane protein
MAPIVIKRLSLRANFSWTLAGNLTYNACQWALIVALAKLGDSEMVGRFTLALALTAPVFMLTNLNLATIQATDARGEHSFGEYLGLRLVCSLMAVGVVILFLLWGGYSETVWPVVLLVAQAKAIESVSDVVHGLMQQHERLDWVAMALVYKGGASVIAMVTTLWLTRDLLCGVMSLTGVWLIVLLTYDLRRARRLACLRPSFGCATLRHLAWVALPLGIVAGLGSLNLDLPRIFVEKHFGPKELGVLGAIGSLAASGRLVSLALSRSAAPRLAQLLAIGRQGAFRALLSKLVLLGAVVGLVGVLAAAFWGRTILSVIYTPEYAARSDLLIWVMATAGVVAAGSFYGTACTALRVYRSQMSIHVMKVGITACFCAMLVPRFGALAAVWGMFATDSFSVLAHAWLTRRALRRLNTEAPLSALK